jgi:calcium-dependent protein kinase
MSSVANSSAACARRSSWLSTFEMLDTDRSGTIDIQELKAGLNALGQPSSDEHVTLLLKAEGLDANECNVDVESFLRMVGVSDEEEKPLDKAILVDMFRNIDLDASEYITTAEMHHFLSNIGLVCGNSHLCH